MKKLKSKKAIIAIALFAVILIGGTIAVSQSNTILRNLFHLGYYQTVSYEEFQSPDNWMTCDVVPKTVFVKNESSMNVAVRISYEEFWKAADDETDLPLEKDGVRLAEIIFQNQDDWNLVNGYYYYKTDLEPNRTTSSLFEAVKLSCDANIVDVEQICTQTATGTVCTDPDDSYNGAHYHLRIKIETIQSEGKAEWQPDESKMLYGVVKQKAQINGLDTGVNFAQPATAATGNGNGANIRSGTQNNNYPIYYYRGEVSDNNVIWGDYCWKILRTTNTGGVKIFYNGPAANNKCTNNNPNPTYVDTTYTLPAGVDIAKYSFPYSNPYLGANYDNVEIGFVGYMNDLIVTNDPWYPDEEISEDPIGKTYYVASDVSYSDGQYHLINPVAITVAWDGEGSNLRTHTNFQTITGEGKYYYACKYLKTTECEEAIFMDNEPYVYSYNGRGYMDITRYRLTGGMKQPELYQRLLRSNVYDSEAKRAVDAWYESNVLGKNIENDIEDTVFCNDRRLKNMPLKSTQYSWHEDDDWFNVFAGYSRLGAKYTDGQGYVSPVNPSYDCASTVDSFTKSEANGNGDLKYSVGIMTGDEMVFAGKKFEENNYSVEHFGIRDWGMTITPLGQIGGSGGLNYTMFGNPGSSTGSGVIRPVVSLKYGTEYVEGGDGTLNNPYIIKQ